ncbi:uncharacterized protein BT62DRAFT_937460 [Guyanagaster necrorhizus]|uniref:Uncharacterized protein n=1 Tax=Guyanagaster necrorhizus TaxID=856835 RepID=A0A9P7VJ86_9AGAR|nr:uncharacterized protein BT62DRAFT_937457 [Guyanagaster necrorhizus MCA 3950]XP_043034526.1 uncharacterized protein BT62DRAFT_937460 [Guyanagaster necrorhizus MCA 3950]KAG7441024.1 hypothetical protein BT62DRAFT_937457 [Guyanagaster necrorhizus MCA 3950]KAG7441026.1 hypothetical protein BT62DRAFT_937460 [Guyanagaster necrorhizus MCA 3950]
MASHPSQHSEKLCENIPRRSDRVRFDPFGLEEEEADNEEAHRQRHGLRSKDPTGYMHQQPERRSYKHEHVPCHDVPEEFEAWITYLLERKRVDSEEHYCKPVALPRVDIPKDPAGFDRWFDSLVSKADKTLHRSTVRDEQTNSTFVDTLSGGPSGSTTAMMGHSYPQHNLPWHLPPPVIYPRQSSMLPFPKSSSRYPAGWIEGRCSCLCLTRMYRSRRREARSEYRGMFPRPRRTEGTFNRALSLIMSPLASSRSVVPHQRVEDNRCAI